MSLRTEVRNVRSPESKIRVLVGCELDDLYWRQFLPRMPDDASIYCAPSLRFCTFHLERRISFPRSTRSIRRNPEINEGIIETCLPDTSERNQLKNAPVGTDAVVVGPLAFP